MNNKCCLSRLTFLIKYKQIENEREKEEKLLLSVEKTMTQRTKKGEEFFKKI